MKQGEAMAERVRVMPCGGNEAPGGVPLWRCAAMLSAAKAMRGKQRIAKAVDCTALNGSAKAEHTPSMRSKGIA